MRYGQRYYSDRRGANMCANPTCDNMLTNADVANGVTHCSDECVSEDTIENSGSKLFDPIDEE